MARRLFLDLENKTFVRDPDSGSPVVPNDLFQGDLVDYELYFLKPGDNGAPPYRAEDFSARMVKLHIGAQPPSTATAYVAAETWADGSTAISATVSRTSAGSENSNEVQAVRLSPPPIAGQLTLGLPARTITATTFRVYAIPQGVDATYAAVGTLISTQTPHGVSVGEQIVLTGFTAPSGFTNGEGFNVLYAGGYNLVVPLKGTGASASSISAGSNGSVVADPVSITIPLPATAQDIAQKLSDYPAQGVNTGNYSVTDISANNEEKKYSIAFVLSKSSTAFPLFSVSAAAAIAMPHKTGSINFNTNELATAISGKASVEAVLEIETSYSGKTDTVAQIPVTLTNDLITSTSPVPVSTLTASSTFNLLSQDGSTWAVSIDNSGILTATKQ
jgi:hypothetical protein